MTITFNNDYTIVGSYFDIWMCQDQNVIPNDLHDENGTCLPLTFWDRASVAGYDQQTTARSMSWVLQDSASPALDPLNSNAPFIDGNGDVLPIDPPADDNGDPISWCNFAGWYFNVNDYAEGGNSNWSTAFSAEGCGDPAPAPVEEAALANTGVNPVAVGSISLIGLLAVVSGVGIVLYRRRKNNS
jgi:hypothetical protein